MLNEIVAKQELHVKSLKATKKYQRFQASSFTDSIRKFGLQEASYVLQPRANCLSLCYTERNEEENRKRVIQNKQHPSHHQKTNFGGEREENGLQLDMYFKISRHLLNYITSCIWKNEQEMDLLNMFH